MKRGRPPDRVVLDVGGTRFTSSVSTLTASSTYFAALFERWENAMGENEEIFLDRDPDTFRVLLSCMRHKKPLMPEDDKDLFKRVILDAAYLGIDWLETEVKSQTMDHASIGDRNSVLQEYNAQHGENLSWTRVDKVGKHVKCWMFDYLYTSLDNCISGGYLPTQFFRHTFHFENKIKQLIPAPADSSVVFFDDDHEEEGYESRRAVCLALLENWHGETRVEPMVRGRGIVKPASDRGRCTWATTEPEDQLVTASRYMGDAGEDGQCHWAYAYGGEASALAEQDQR